MKPRLGIDDVLLQVAITAAFHWAVEPKFVAVEFLARCGAVVPAALIVLALFRAWREPAPVGD